MADDKESVRATIFGIPVAINGVSMAVVVLLAVALGVVGFLFWQQVQLSNALQTQEHSRIVDTLKEMQGVNQHIGELVEEQNYIVLSDDKDRAVMKSQLRKPDSLRRKLGQ